MTQGGEEHYNPISKYEFIIAITKSATKTIRMPAFRLKGRPLQSIIWIRSFKNRCNFTPNKRSKETTGAICDRKRDGVK